MRFSAARLVCILPLLAGGIVAQQSSSGFVTSVVARPIASSTTTPTAASPTLNLVSSSAASSLSTTAPACNLTVSNNGTTSCELDIRVDATFGILGALLVLTGLPTAFYGSRNRWSSFFFIGTYTGMALVSLLILHFAVAGQLHSTKSTTRGLYLFASLAGGVTFGGAAILFSTGAQLLCGGLSGFVIGLALLACRSDSLIRPLGFRYILLIGLATLGFVLATVRKITNRCLLFGTATIGATAIVLGVDCFTTAGLKEFYVYNLGLAGLFPAHRFTVTLGIAIELGAIAALSLCAIACQYRLFDTVVAKARDLQRADQARDEDEAKAGVRLEKANARQADAWEDRYGAQGSEAQLVANGWAHVASTSDLPHSDSNASTPAPSTPNFAETESQVDLLPEIDFNAPPRPPYARIGSHSRGSSASSAELERYLASRTSLYMPPQSSNPQRAPTPFGMQHSRSQSSSTTAEDDVPLAKLAGSPSPTASGFSPRVPGPRPQPLPARLPSRPSSLALTALPDQPSLQRPKHRPSHSSTMIDLSSPAPAVAPPMHKRSSTSERIVVGNRRESFVPVAPPSPQVMDYTELATRHRRRLSALQSPTSLAFQAEAEAAAVKASYEERQSREAAIMRRREREGARSVSMSQRLSSSSLSVLIERVSSFNGEQYSPSLPSGNTFGRPFSVSSRRQSLSDLLEQPPTAATNAVDSTHRRAPVRERRESRRLSGMERVAEWQLAEN